MGWLIALAVLAGIAILPIGVRCVYRESKAGVWLLVGPLRFRVYPTKHKNKKVKAAALQKQSPDMDLKKGGKLRDFLPLAKTFLEFLGQLRRKVRVKRLELKVILAGDDPCDLAVNYGRAWAALGNVMPYLDRFLAIRKQDVEVECDFVADSTRVYATVDAVIPLGRAVCLVTRYGVKLIKDILNLKKLRKGGAEL